MTTSTLDVNGLLEGTLRVPDEYADSLPCVLQQDLFTDPLLDVALDSEEFVRLPGAEQHAQVARKQAVERECVLACQGCPMLQECREWALGTRVHGVAGGLTESQRAAAKGEPSLDQVLTVVNSGDLSVLRDHQIHAMTIQGYPTSFIAETLGVDERTVQRRRKDIQENGLRRVPKAAPASSAGSSPDASESSTAEVDYQALAEQASRVRRSDRDRAKSESVNSARVSDLTAEIYRFLADGAITRRRDDVIAAVEHLVDPEQAARNSRGARKVVMDRLRIAERDGRIETVVFDKVVYVKLQDSLREQFAPATTDASRAPASSLAS